MTNKMKLAIILRHIKMVESHMQRLAMEFVETDIDFACKLIINSRKHDLSKFNSFEFEHLWDGDELFADALKIHHLNNQHHPEYFNHLEPKYDGVNMMLPVEIAEMVCDCFARSNEFGTDIRNWFTTVAPVKYNFETDDSVGKLINYYLNVLLRPKFS